MTPLSPLVTFFTVWPIVVTTVVFCLWLGRRWEARDEAARFDTELLDWRAIYPLDDEGEAA